MKALLHLLCGVLVLASLPAAAQTDDQSPGATADQAAASAPATTSTTTAADQDDSGAPPAPTGSTLITSDELHSDQVTHVSVFTGNVVVIGTNFRMTCEEMTVNFTKDNKVDTIIATGNVIIHQPDRVTNCGRADYFHDEDKFILTEQPVIHDHQNIVYGPKIIIYRTTQKMQVEGGRSNVILGPSAMKSSSSDSSTNAPSATPSGSLPQ